MYLQERRQSVLKRVQEKGRVSVAELSDEFGVSEVTIRQDLQALSESKLIVRTFGGAVPADGGLYELTLALRRGRRVQEKRRIGQAGAAMVKDSDAIFVDSSSTALAIAQNLTNLERVTVITNGLAVAQELLAIPSVTVVMIGGKLRRDTASLVGTDGLDVARKFNIRKGFFGASGLSIKNGLTDVSVEEAETKQQIIKMCHHVVAVIDATKWGQVGVISFASLHDINTIISDSNVPDDLHELTAYIRELEIETILV